MKHGKAHRAEIERSLPGWKRKFLSYKGLKKKVRHTEFRQSLDRELDKVNTFYIDKEEDYVIMFRGKKYKENVMAFFLVYFQEFESRAENQNDNDEQVSELLKDVLDFYSEMVMLLHYSVINFQGLMKIVKKHKKRACGSSYSSYILRVLQQPFFSTELLYNLIKGCEAILERLSPPNDP